MAARTLKPFHQEHIKDKIRGSQLINRLRNHVLGKVDLSSSQVNAALGLLRKIVPDLASSTVTVQTESMSEVLERVSQSRQAIAAQQTPISDSECTLQDVSVLPESTLTH